MRTGLIAVCVLAALSSVGCTHIQLHRNTLGQARTVSQIYEKQVLDNLAAFCHDSNSTPFFSVADSGTNSVNDSLGANANSSALALQFWKFVSLTSSRGMNQNWTLKPVVDSNRLALMQCAYQKAVGAVPTDCQRCCELETAWFGEGYDCCGPCSVHAGWICSSSRWKDVPKCCCESYGFHCGTYVWVNPNHREDFAALVLRILNYATGSKATPKAVSKDRKTVTFYLNADGSPGTVRDHNASIVAEVEAGKSLNEIEDSLRILIKSRELAEKEKLLSVLAEPDPTKRNTMLMLQPPTTQSKANELIETNQTDLSKAQSILREQIENLRGEIYQLSSAVESAPVENLPNVDFGRPTQENGFNSLQLKQQLDAIGNN